MGSARSSPAEPPYELNYGGQTSAPPPEAGPAPPSPAETSTPERGSARKRARSVGVGPGQKYSAADEPGERRGSGDAASEAAAPRRSQSGRFAPGSKWKVAKNAVRGNSAFGAAGDLRARRTSRLNTKFGWVARDMTMGPDCNVGKFDLGRIIGTGLMGTVYIAKWRKDETYVALKSVSKAYVCRHNDGRHVHNERRILRDLSHPFILKGFGTFQDPDHIFFVLEYVPGGELFSRLKRKEYFPAGITKFYLVEILSALVYLHEQGYVYRDLKPENILLDEEGHCKLVDFGFARKPGTDGLCHTNVGTPAYLSPEQLNGKFTKGYSSIVDWWSVGIIIYEMMTGKTPFCKNNSETSYAIYLRVFKGKISFPSAKRFPPVVKSIVKSLLVADVTKRLTTPANIKSHEWLADVNWNAVGARKAVPPYVPRIVEAGDCHYFNDYGMKGGRTSNTDVDQSVFTGF